MIDKSLLKDGDIFLFHAKGFNLFSMAIRELTQSYWNHCGLYYSNVYKEGFIIEALGNGVVKNPVENYLAEKHSIIKVVRLKPEAFKDEQEYQQGIVTAISRMQEKIGSKYDWWGIVWLGFKYLFKGAYKKTRQYVPVGNPLQSREKFWCSEIICEAFYKISSLYDYLFQGNTKQTCDTTTPKDIGKSKLVQFVEGYNVN